MSLGEQLTRLGLHWKAGQLIQDGIDDTFTTLDCTGNNSQANAAQIVVSVNTLNAGATTNSARLPDVTTYTRNYCVVRNGASGNNAYLFPSSGQSILGLGANNGLTMASSTAKAFFKQATGWIMVG